MKDDESQVLASLYDEIDSLHAIIRDQEADLQTWEDVYSEQQLTHHELLNAQRDYEHQLASLGWDLAAADLEIQGLSQLLDELQDDVQSEYRARRNAEATVEEQRLTIIGLLDKVDELERLLGP